MNFASVGKKTVSLYRRVYLFGKSVHKEIGFIGLLVWVWLIIDLIMASLK